jgi:hypothetical protein
LIGGDNASGKRKKDKWSGWYKTAIPKAERCLHRDGYGPASRLQYRSQRFVVPLAALFPSIRIRAEGSVVNVGVNP